MGSPSMPASLITIYANSLTETALPVDVEEAGNCVLEAGVAEEG